MTHNVENLTKLMNKLRSLPEGYAAFSMSAYLRRGEASWNLSFSEYAKKALDYALHNGGVHECGSVACAVGHGPAAGILFKEDLIDQWGEPDWIKYTVEMFLPDVEFNRLTKDNRFQWMFGAGWTHVDNTPKGAAARIEYFLNEGIPEGFSQYVYFHHFVGLYLEYIK